MTKARLVEDVLSLGIRIDGVDIVIDEVLHRQTEGGFEALGEVSQKIEEVFDQLAEVVGNILDSAAGSPSLTSLYLDGLKGAIIAYLLLQAAQTR